jgi:hypothetical protein
MRLVWNGRSYRPVTNFIKVEKDDINELMKPLSQKTKLGSAVLTGYVINAVPAEEGGTTPDVTPTPSVTPTFTPTQTQTNTPTNTATPTLTPSSTPYILPSTPDLWYDSTNIGSIDYITSGGTDYVSAWRSIGTYSKTLTGTTTDTMPQWSGSTSLPGNPKIVRFTKSATAGLREFLTQRFDSTVITGAGITAFYVMTTAGYNYSGTTNANGFGAQFYLYSGNTTNGGFTPITPLINQPPRVFNNNFGAGLNSSSFILQNSGITNAYSYSYSATNLNDKFLLTLAAPYPTGNQYLEINQSGATNTTAITGTPVTTFNSFIIGASVVSGGTLTAQNAGMELAEVMIYTRELTYQQRVAVQNYLRDKWRYDEWASPVPTPTPSITPSITSSPTNTVTPTPSSTPTVFSPSGVTNLQLWFMSNSGATTSSWTNYGLLGGSATQSVAIQQPSIESGITLGTGFTGTAVRFVKPSIGYTGSTSNTSVTAHTQYMVYKPVTPTPAGWYISLASGTSYSFGYGQTSSASSVANYKGTINFSPINTASLLISSGNSSNMYGTINGSFSTSGTSGSYTGTTLSRYLISSDGPDNYTQNVYMFEWLYYNRELTTTEHNNVVNYLKTKYVYSGW